MPHMNTRTYLPFVLIAAVLLATAAACLATGAGPADLTPRQVPGIALRAL